jgi:hypothetical protein
VLDAVANLDRVRALKAAAREADVEARHEQALARIRRQAELTAASNDAPACGDTDEVTIAEQQVEPYMSTLDSMRHPPIDLPRGTTPPDRGRTGTSWCRDRRSMSRHLGQGVCRRQFGAGTAQRGARSARYGLSAKQVRSIRHAATSGALRRRVEELGVPLPSAYVDSSGVDRVDGHDVVVVPA